MARQHTLHQQPCCRSYHIPEEVLELIFSFIDDPQDRSSISLVCRTWHAIDNLTRKHVTIAFSYAVTPACLTRRFKRLQSLKLKGKPRADMFDLVPKNWGGYAEPWVQEISENCRFLTALNFRRMVVSDEDLFMLAKERRHMLQVIKLEKCSGFSTIGLESIARFCRSLRILLLDESSIEEHNGKWLHELALHNSSLEALSFCATDLSSFDVEDLDTIAANCPSLTSLRVSEIDLKKLTGVLKRAAVLTELGGVSLCSNDAISSWQPGEALCLPVGLTSLVGLTYMGEEENGDNDVKALIEPVAPILKKLDLQRAALTVEGHCQILSHCTNLEVLEVLNDIGDEGLEVVSKNCKKLRRLRVESGAREFQQGYVTQRGLVSIAEGCKEIEYIVMYTANMNNAALIRVGEACRNLKDFRLGLVEDDNFNPEYPLDDGVYALLRGCSELTRLALYLTPGSLSDTGMGYIGTFGRKIKWALIGLLGETDTGLSLLADGCPKLEKLEIRDCVFTEAGISSSVLKMKSLKYIWVQGYKATSNGQDLLAMRKMPFWNIEFVPEQRNVEFEEGAEAVELAVRKKPAELLGYHSLAGPRTDYPETVTCLA